MRRVATLLIVAAIAASACSDDESAIAVAPAGGDAVASATGWTPEAQVRLDAARQRQVRDCMADAGLEYEPVVRRTGDPDLTGPLGVVTRDAQASYQREFGYGLFASYFRIEERRAAATDGIDPNMVIAASLGTNGQQAYYDALNGCHAAALPLPESIAGVGDEFAVRYDDAEVAMAADPRWEGMWRTWSACMADHGHDATHRDDLVEGLIARGVAELGLPEQVEDGRQALVFDQQDPTYDAIDPDDVRALQAEELAVAGDDLDCWDEQSAEVDALRDEYLVPVVEDHRAALEEYRAWLDDLPES